jgi:hypothetical protein
MSRKIVRRLAAVGLVLALVGGFVAWQLWPKSLVPPAWANEYDVSAKPPETIPPGTVVGTGPPEGWSHLVLKSLPRVRPSEESKIPGEFRSRTIRMSRWMFTAFVADVRPETRGDETRYHLRAVALGLGTSINGRDVIITPDTAEAHGVELDKLITRPILTKGYKTQQQFAKVAAHGPTFAVVDTPVWFRCGQKNRLIRFRFGLLVDAATGQLDVLVWLLDPEGKCGDAGVAVLLNPSQINEAELVPDREEFTDLLGLANDATFGVDQLPPHKAQLAMPAEVRELAARTKFSADEAHDLETALRKLITP